MGLLNTKDKVAVCSRSFSKNIALRDSLLARYKHVTFNDQGLKLTGDSLVNFLRGHDKAITALEVIDENVLSKLTDLKVIGKHGVGLDMIDMDAMRKYGVNLGWTGGVNKRSVSELVISFAISLLRHVSRSNREVLAGTWRQNVGGCLSERTFGIIGCGHIGKDLIQLLQNFNCHILANDIKNYADFYKKFDIEPVDLDDLLSRSDIVTLHVPLDSSTFNILDMRRLSLMKSTAILINTARGGLVDEVALKKQLKSKKIAAAAFDVFLEEPPQDFELLELDNFISTPHIGGSAEESILAMGKAAIDGLDNYKIPS